MKEDRKMPPYTESQALETQGTTFTWDGKTVGEQVSFAGPGGVAGTYQVTNLQSTRVEKRPSLPDEGDFSFECNLVPNDEGQLAILADKASRTVRTCILTLSDGTTLTFDAYCTGFAISGGVDTKIAAAVTLAVTDKVVWSNMESS
jgi:hypothetical protein